MTTPPPGYRDWPALAAAAAHILAQRTAGDPAQVAAGKMTADQAAHRMKNATALARQWACVIDRTDAPADGWAWFESFGAHPLPVRLDLANVARNAAARAKADPANASAAELAAACAALAWWQRPQIAGDDMPHILHVHAANQFLRAVNAARPAPAPRPLPPRAVPRATAPQRALL